MPGHEAIELRHRAQRLRHLASRIESSMAMSLERHAGNDTWRGRRPLLCVNLLRHNQAQLHAEVDGLRWQAYLFDQQAARLDQAAALQPGRAS
ncbi:hypothetical protein [Ilumatobacter sp.]|uniref:hypothetical protein n=1 Tax=Ilumatobacter sp. TaxID=1967498 RepID=UPI003753C55D